MYLTIECIKYLHGKLTFRNPILEISLGICIFNPNTIMPNRRIIIHINDSPWITANFKNHKKCHLGCVF